MRLLAVALAIGLSLVFWYQAGREQQAGIGLIPGQKLQCVSYTPFAAGQSPLAGSVVDPRQIERDFERLSHYFSCVRIYAVKDMQELPALAEKHGLTVIAGAWITRDEAANEGEIAQLIALANRWPETIGAVLVGNEVLLRQERNAAQLASYLQRVKAAVRQPVSYGDVWDFWLQNPELAQSVDFITIHLLPYWENQPSGIEDALHAVSDAHAAIEHAFPGRQILIGETGWPSEGRQRESAVPSRVNQARFIRGFIRLAEQSGWRYNLIEAFDQPWKRLNEGTVGGYWGMFDADRNDKQILAGPVSNLPGWRRWLLLGIGLWLLLQFGSGWCSPVATLIAATGANLTALHLLHSEIASRTPYEHCWNLALAVVAAAVIYALLRQLAGRTRPRWQESAVLVLAVLACIEMLGLVFDPRYREFPVAVFATPALAIWRLHGAELEFASRVRVLGALLALCLPAVLLQETWRNTQALAWAAVMALLAYGLMHRNTQGRAIRGSASVNSANTAAGAPKLTL